MNYATVNAAFYASLVIVLPIGLILMILWARKILKSLTRSIEKSGSLDLQMISFKTLVYMFPGMLVFILFSIPAIYFNYLLKQEAFCKKMIEVNKMTVTNRDLEEKCGSLDINELLENSKAKQ